MLLVTGATGFVGKGLRETLRQKKIACRTASRRASDVDFAVGDIDGTTDWSDTLKDIDVVVHLAALNQNVVEGSSAHLEGFVKVNVEGTVNLARQAAEAGVRRFVYLSTVKVNGEWTETGKPFRPDDPPKPETPYAVSKLEAERRLRSLADEQGIEIVIIRPPLVYGNGVRGSFEALARLVGKRVPLPLGAIKGGRSMVYLGNLTDLILAVAYHPHAAGKTFLVSDDEDVSVPELLKITAAATGRSVWLLPVPARLLEAMGRAFGKADLVYRLTRSLQVDISETKSRLGWVPPFGARQALAETLRSIQVTKAK